MNREDRRYVKVLMVGGPVDGKVYLLPANRISYDAPVAPFAYERYVIRTLHGRLGTWKIAWPAREGECGYDAALCKVLNYYHEEHSPDAEVFCTQSDIAEGEKEFIER